MRDTGERWILAFDASCGTCREITGAVGQACDGKLDVLPLGSELVRGWRAAAFGSNPPWTPTLLRVREQDDGDVRAWTGKGMALTLARHLGPRSTVAVLRALGELRVSTRIRVNESPSVDGPASPSSPSEMGRARFLQIVAGVAVAGGLILAGNAPAFAEQRRAAARAWADARVGALPTSYDEVGSYPMLYRKAIYQASTPAVRSSLWVAQLNRFRAAQLELAHAQSDALETALALAADISTFELTTGALPTAHARLQSLKHQVGQAFSKQVARSLLATLGPSESSAAVTPAVEPPCNCAIDSDFCDVVCIGMQECECGTTSSGCGAFYLYGCTGQCTPISDCG